MRNRILPHEIEGSKNKIKNILKSNSKIEDLDEKDLYILNLMIQKELQKRESRLARRGIDPNMRMLDF